MHWSYTVIIYQNGFHTLIFHATCSKIVEYSLSHYYNWSEWYHQIRENHWWVEMETHSFCTCGTHKTKYIDNYIVMIIIFMYMIYPNHCFTLWFKVCSFGIWLLSINPICYLNEQIYESPCIYVVSKNWRSKYSKSHAILLVISNNVWSLQN